MRKVSGPNMAANNFRVFNESKTNMMNDTDYSTHTQRENGVSSGLAVSALHNKLYRQTSIVAKAVADFIASQELDATDNDSMLFSTNLLMALEKVTKVPLDVHRTKGVLDHPDSSVTTPKIANRNITTEKIAYNSVGTDELKSEVFNNHNADFNAHSPILNAIKAITGMGTYNVAPSKTLAEIIPLLGFGGIVAQRLETNGYVKFANGLTIQWGDIRIHNRETRITFPIQFPTKCFCGLVTAQKDSGNLSGSQCNPAVRIADTTGMVAIMYDNTNTGWYWLAIGI